MPQLLLVICLLLSSSVWAEEVQTKEDEVIISENTSEETESTADDEEDIEFPISIEAMQEDFQDTRKELPLCNNEQLLNQVQNMLQKYDEENPVESIYEKRQRALQLKFTHEYTEEQVAGFTSRKNQLVADKLLMTKINQHLNDDEIRLCKSKVEDKQFKPIYLMIYADHNNVLQLHILNYIKNSTQDLSAVLVLE